MRRETVAVGLRSILLLLALTGCRGIITPESPARTPGPVPTDTRAARRVTATAPLQPSPATSTATITPTPMVHVVRGGETLLGIAAQYGVSVEALRTVNGITDPQLLQPGQELIIPTGQVTVSAEPDLLLPTPTPIPFGVRGVGFYETPVGSLDCLGEVVNTTPYTLTNIQVRVTLFDAAGTPLVEGDAFAAASVLRPTARAPFRILFISPPPSFAGYDATPVRGEFGDALAAGFVPLSVEDTASSPAGPQFEVSGTVRNTDAARTAVGVVVIATTYDGEGLVTGFRQRTVDVGEGLAPGAASPFRLLLSAYGDTAADFSIVAFGRPLTEEEGSQPGG